MSGLIGLSQKRNGLVNQFTSLGIDDNATSNAVTIDGSENVTITDGAHDFDVASHDTSNGLKLGGTLVTASATELNTAADGSTSPGTTAVASGDGLVTNDGGTMRQTTVATLDTYLSASTKTLTNKTLTSPTLTTPVLGTPQSGTLTSCTFPTIMPNGGGSIKWRHTYYNSHFSIATNQYWANYDIGPTSILDADDERQIFLYLNLKNRWTGNYRMNGPCALYHSSAIQLHQGEMTIGYLLLTVVTSGSNYHLRFQNTYSPANVTTPLSGHIFQATNVDFT